MQEDIQELQPTQPWLIIATAVFGISILAIVLADALRKKPEQSNREIGVPSVSVLILNQPTKTFHIESFGLVRPVVSTQLAAEITGRVLALAPAFDAGQKLISGQVLATIEDTDYLANLRAAEAEYARAEAALEQAQEESRQAEKDWATLGRSGKANNLALKKPQLAQAKATLKSAVVGLTKARRDLERTQIKAPYDAIVVQRFVNLDYYLAPGTVLGEIYGTAQAQVRLGVQPSEAQWLKKNTQSVVLKLKQNPHISWPAQLHQIEQHIDEKNRQIYVNVRVSAPYDDQRHGAALLFGSYVQAQFTVVPDLALFKIPRVLLKPGHKLWLVDEHQHLRLRQVSVAYTDARFAYLSAGVASGDQVLLSALSQSIEGMKVKITIPDTARG